MTTDYEGAAKLLETAADLLEKNGRCTGRYTDSKGRYCVSGALRAAQGLLGRRSNYQTYFTADELLFVKTRGVIGWNDDPKTTDEEVLTTMRAVAQEARSKGNESND